MMRRRSLLKHAGAAAGLSLASVGLTTRLALGATAAQGTRTDKRFVLVFLRGGLDGLHAVIPHGDGHYRDLRPTLALPDPGEAGGVLDLDGQFGLHPALAPLHTLYRSDELLVVPAAATVYRDRSHFDGQNLLENGSGTPFGARDGWLNRAAGILATEAGPQAPHLGLALGPSVPLILRGDAAVQTWSNSQLPALSDDFLGRLARVYASDPAFAATLEQALGAPAPDLGDQAGRRRAFGGDDLDLTARAAADLLARPDGPRIAVIESQGWDTHFDQGRRLNLLLADLAGAVATLKQGLEDAWQDTSVLIVSEFGRTAAENGSRGTDHGTGGVALLAGGAVRGGRVVGDWPGLRDRDLHEGRDLQAVNGYEAIFTATLVDHLGLAPDTVESTVLPASRADRRMTGLYG